MTSRFPPVALPQTPYAPAVQSHCLGHEGAWEDYPWGQVVYKVGARMFALLGVDGAAATTVSLKATSSDADALLELPFIERAAYIGRYGWVKVSVGDNAALELARDLITASYELVQPKRSQRRR